MTFLCKNHVSVRSLSVISSARRCSIKALLWFIVVVLVLLAGVNTSGQERKQSTVPKPRQTPEQASVPTIPLDVSKDIVPTDAAVQGFVGAILCDAEGNIYAQSGAPHDKRSVLTNPVVRISTRTGRSTSFQTENIAGLDLGARVETDTFAYAVDAGGSVYELVREFERHESSSSEDFYIVAFSRDGDFAWKSKFSDLDWRPRRFLPLPSGDFLVGGEEPMAGDGPKTSFTAIFGTNAELKRRLTDSRSKGASAQEEQLILDDDALLGSDGNIYLPRRSVPPKVDVFSQSGRLLRTINLRSPMPGAKAYDFFIGPSRLLVAYSIKDLPEGYWGFYGLYDLQTGDLIENFYLPIKGALRCFTGQDVTILVPMDNGSFGITHAIVK